MNQCAALTIKGVQCTRKTTGEFCGMHTKLDKSILISFTQDHYYHIEDLKNYKEHFEKQNYTCDLINLNEVLSTYDTRRTEEAKILIVRNFHEHDVKTLEKLKWETQTILRKKLVNRRDKYTLDFNNTDVPLLIDVKAKLDIQKDNIEGHYYFNNRAGEKYHGNLNTVYVNFGQTNLYFQWFFNKQKEGNQIKITLNNDLLIMSEKSCGSDFRSKLVPILKHAIGDNFKN